MTITEYLSKERNGLYDTQAAEEFWLMETVAFHFRPIGQLYPEFVLPKMLTQEPQEFATDHLFKIFESLAGQGIVEFIDDINQRLPGGKFPVLSFEAMTQKITRENCLYISCALSAAGAQLWERTAKPDWDQYISGGTLSVNDGDAEATATAESMNVALIESYLQDPAVSARIIPGSMQWIRREPYKITYWKTVPLMHRVSFRFTFPDEAIHAARPLYVDGHGQWYTTPFP